MTELKWQWVYYPYLDAPTKQEESALKAGYIKVVVKEDADKVIDDKEKEIAKLSELLTETREWLIESQKMHKRCADNAIKQLRHQKFKRCRANAKWCHDMWFLLRFDKETKKSVFYWRWWNIWLELADKFKEEK